jgi:hypothetical protein
VLNSASADGRSLLVSGHPWLHGEEKWLPTKALGSNVLCTRHNNALSDLDATAGKLFRVLDGFQTALADPSSPARHGSSLIGVFTGPDLERWLLKVLWGGISAGAFGFEGESITSLRSDIDHESLLETLFRGQAWPKGWGLYMGFVPGARLQEDARLSYTSATGPDGSAWQVTVSIGVVDFRVTLGTPDGVGPNLVRQPGGVVLEQQGGTGHLLLALAWPDVGHHIVRYSRLPDDAAVTAN